MKMSSTSNSHQGRIWTHRPFEITPSSTTKTTTNPSISHCPLPTKTPTPPLENRFHSVYQSEGSEALAQLCQSKQEFYKTQFSARVATEDADRIRKLKLQSSSISREEAEVTIYLPKSKPDDAKKLHGICLHVHGGGWIWGDSQYQVAHRCLEMTEMMNVAVVSVEYSLASTLSGNGQIFDPVSEVESAIDWIENTGADELNTKSVFVASGESSGAHLLLLSMLKRRDRAEGMTLPSTWKCLNLVYGFYDLSGSPSVRADGNDSSPMCGNELLCMADLYCEKILQVDDRGGDGGGAKITDRQHPSISPMYANLCNLPPALISVGTADPLLDDSLFLASRYSLCGNDVETVLYEGGEHGIGHFGLQEDDEMGRRAREHTLQFMKRYI
eukprot:CAMPEP_0201739126 /NCGR_PEP_ID=MMETSP0593-20130828/45614_1 /ASSEMBLY_ACC=CAM_ASM_000672 /TAXON_ID=267983 /ORGANISM="Skeletonema japonicum, Strain CCMP2506" /LENGTH=385 /DNA_ID=CAMNT_0048233377 /DNA_START=55 /DNA_END=1212 /DNA_ORIENTATION=+